MYSPPQPTPFGKEPLPPLDVPIDNPIAIAILMTIAIIYVLHNFGYFKQLKSILSIKVPIKKFNTLKGFKMRLNNYLVD